MSDFDIDAFLRPGESETFTLFPNLPAELQLLIWEAVVPDPAVLTFRSRSASEVDHSNCNINDNKCTAGLKPVQLSRDESRVILDLFSPDYEEKISRQRLCPGLTNAWRPRFFYRVPAMLHTCSMSRAIGLPKYSPTFTDRRGRFLPIYFQPSRDLVVMEDPEALALFLRTPWWADVENSANAKAMQTMRYLAIGGSWVTYEARIKDRLQDFHALERLFLGNVSQGGALDVRKSRADIERMWQRNVRSLSGVWEDTGLHLSAASVHFIQPGEWRGVVCKLDEFE